MTISLAIASGKGGVGKTTIAVNLAITLQRMGSRVTIMDADFGLANAHILMGQTPRSPCPMCWRAKAVWKTR